MPLRWSYPAYFPRFPKPPVRVVSSKVKVTLASELDHSGDVGVYIQSAGQELVFKPTDPRQLQLSLDANICQYVVPESEATYDFDVLYRWKFARYPHTKSLLPSSWGFKLRRSHQVLHTQIKRTTTTDGSSCEACTMRPTQSHGHSFTDISQMG